MRFDKDHLTFIRNQYLTNKAFCDIFLILAVLFFISISISATKNYLSETPEKGHEPRQYAECKNIKSYHESCERAGSASNDDSEGNKEDSKSSKYQPNTFIKDKRDVNAQEGMWRATNAVAVFTLFQIFLGGAGLAIVLLTLNETRKVLKEAAKTTRQASLATEAAIRSAEAAENAERPHVFVDWQGEYATTRLDKKEGRVRALGSFLVDYFIFNNGKSPAYNILFVVSREVIPQDIKEDELSEMKQYGMPLGIPMLGTGDKNKARIDCVWDIDGTEIMIEHFPPDGLTYHAMWFYDDMVKDQRLRVSISMNFAPIPKQGKMNELIIASADCRNNPDNWDIVRKQSSLYPLVTGVASSYSNIKITIAGKASVRRG